MALVASAEDPAERLVGRRFNSLVRARTDYPSRGREGATGPSDDWGATQRTSWLHPRYQPPATREDDISVKIQIRKRGAGGRLVWSANAQARHSAKRLSRRVTPKNGASAKSCHPWAPVLGDPKIL